MADQGRARPISVSARRRRAQAERPAADLDARRRGARDRGLRGGNADRALLHLDGAARFSGHAHERAPRALRDEGDAALSLIQFQRRASSPRSSSVETSISLAVTLPSVSSVPSTLTCWSARSAHVAASSISVEEVRLTVTACPSPRCTVMELGQLVAVTAPRKAISSAGSPAFGRILTRSASRLPSLWVTAWTRTFWPTSLARSAQLEAGTLPIPLITVSAPSCTVTCSLVSPTVRVC